jgi:hypothetical protein
MARVLIFLVTLTSLLAAGETALAQESPVEVSPCDLAEHPKNFDRKKIRVRAAVNVHFEDFTLAVPHCDTRQTIWLAFGGDVPGIVASMVNDTFRKPGVDLKVEGVAYGVEKDEAFRRFYALIAASHEDKPAYRVTATLIGAFFAGEERKLASGEVNWGGYGHLGCCALFIITRVEDSESIPPANLNLHGTVIGPDRHPAKDVVLFDDVLGGSPPERQKAATNSRGEFEFTNSGQMLRIQDPHFRPVALRVEPGGPAIHVKLEDARSSDWVVSSCTKIANPADRIGLSVLYILPRNMDYTRPDVLDRKTYFVFQRGRTELDAEMFISPFEEGEEDTTRHFDSSWSAHRWIKDSSGTVLGIDSRGRDKKGGRWRTTVFYGRDRVDYSVKRGEHTTSLDAIIDSACLQRR